jgi:type II secretory pathway predicted ATPase ExeA/predicted transcriptional regulator
MTQAKPTQMRQMLDNLLLTQRDAARLLGVSDATLKRYVNAGTPMQDAERHARMQDDLRVLLEARGESLVRVRKAQRELVRIHELATLASTKENAQGSLAMSPGRKNAAIAREAVPAAPSTPAITTEEDVPMLLQKQTLTQAARQHFNLPRDPFTRDVQTSADVFQTANVRYVRTVLLDAALHHGFVAITGESGAGKSTLAEDLEQRIIDDRRDVLVIRPYVLQMELSDTKGKTLKSGEIARAIIRTLDETVTCKSSPDALMRQLHTMLQQSARSGRQHLLLIEEAHCLPIATLKHLKRFIELKDGMRPLLGVALIGQTELRSRLLNAGPEVREVTQRCELIELAPLDADVGPYLAHKFARFGLKLDQVFAPDAADAIRARLIHLPRGGKPTDAQSICYPLIVNNLVTRAMNAAADAGYPVVDAQVIAGV